MFSEGQNILFTAFIELHFTIQSSLPPKARNRSSYLNMGKALTCNFYYLLCFTKVSHVSFLVNSSRVIPRPSLGPASSRYECIVENCSIQGRFEIANGSLD